MNGLRLDQTEDMYVSEEGKAVKEKSMGFCKDVHGVRQGLANGV